MIPEFIGTELNNNKYFSDNKIENEILFSISRINAYECSIFLSISNDPCYIQNCKHIYCISCIKRWMLSSEKCPFCWAKIDKIKRLFHK